MLSCPLIILFFYRKQQETHDTVKVKEKQKLIYIWTGCIVKSNYAACPLKLFFFFTGKKKERKIFFIDKIFFFNFIPVSHYLF